MVGTTSTPHLFYLLNFFYLSKLILLVNAEILCNTRLYSQAIEK